ncbi:ring-1,2-phenylacetyl-CoA epoxidase subunit PaaD [Fodinibius salinus]|uniref:Ring-1,2-phenylacetyl-CoA epoxidase subunit PaaD n=1 Tax=Fodinibius salinus TaxID=860790 RepID=A0A5D3YNY5_9BACT|nr:1,2-phenylacetyl-CoA epoxidase subunit PaaD [Fodinibius salinus]TYP94729.1 ring-1,2-phenylacetyl-CoA epoxidase subunit PaaD [Fodinibius salinus]
MPEPVTKYSKEDIWELIAEVTDPEIPVLTIVDLGIARSVEREDDTYVIKITPTYSGCPAMKAIEDEIEKTLRKNGIQNFEVRKDFSETWTTDWMSDDAKKKLKDYGISPPGKTDPDEDFLSSLKQSDKTISCPYCDSQNTELQSEFGSTACKSQYYCHDCDEPFEHFKCI